MAETSADLDLKEVPAGSEPAQENSYDGLKEKFNGTMEGAVLELLHGLAQRENQGDKVETSFNYGKHAGELLARAIETGCEWLETPYQNHYIAFSWTELDKEGRKIIAGSIDLRLISYGQNNVLRIFSNMGALSDETKRTLDEILGGTDYPVCAEDRDGFFWENRRYRAMHVSDKI